MLWNSVNQLMDFPASGQAYEVVNNLIEELNRVMCSERCPGTGYLLYVSGAQVIQEAWQGVSALTGEPSLDTSAILTLNPNHHCA